MSFSRVQLQSRLAHDRVIYDAAAERKPMGLTRGIFTSIVILFGAFMYYIAMHYVPALANPGKVVRFANQGGTLPPGVNEFEFEDPSALEQLLRPYFKLFVLDRSYMRAGEAIEIRYEIPEGTTVDLDIVQCRRIWVVEIFKCDIVNQFTVTKKTRRGIATYALGNHGFYHFRHRVNGLKAEDHYRLVWERVATKPQSGTEMAKHTLRPA